MAGSEQSRELDVVLWGATGFTGRLVAEHLQRVYGVGKDLQWAIAGRNATRLEALRHTLGAADLPLIVADSHDSATLEALAVRARVVCSTVGPYAKHGSKLVAACVATGTDYCDITGEVPWIRRMIDAHGEAARETGSRVVHCCGFDSIPSDLGTLFVTNLARERGTRATEVKFRLRRSRGGFSGGTVASLMNVLEEAKTDREVRRVLGNPYGLNPDGERQGPDGPDSTGPEYDEDLGGWTAPFVMAAINTRIVRRSNALMSYPYGRDFRYSEAVMTGKGPMGWTRAAGVSAGLGGVLLAGSFDPTRALLEKFVLPAPGEGPDADEREGGSFDIVFLARCEDGSSLRATVRGDRDPGYGSTSRMLGESAVCLARDVADLPGGSWTPASALGRCLIPRLEQSAGVTFASS